MFGLIEQEPFEFLNDNEENNVEGSKTNELNNLEKNYTKKNEFENVANYFLSQTNGIIQVKLI